MSTAANTSSQTTDQPHRFGKAFKPLLTPLTIAGFLIISITGVMMFFHIESGAIKFAHEWLGWGFLLAGVFHGVVLHKKSLKNHLNKGASKSIIFGGLLLTILLMASPLINLGIDDDMPDHLKAAVALYNADLKVTAQVLKISDTQLQEKLAAEQLLISDNASSLKQIAEENDIPPQHIIKIVLR